MNVKSRAIIRAFIVGILLLFVFELLIVVITQYNNETIEAELSKKSYAIQNQIEKVLLNVYTINDAYKSYMQEHPDATKDDVESFLKYLLHHEENYVNNIAYIEDTTIKFNYPYEENKTSIGVNLLEVEAQREDILYVKEELEALFIGPVELVQGGKAFILRVPVIYDNEYVGQIATVIDADELLSLMNTQASDFYVGLKLTSLDGEEFLSIGDDFEGIQVRNTFESEYTDWYVIVYDTDQEDIFDTTKLAIRGLTIFVILIVCYYVYKNGVLLEEVQYKVHHDSLTNDFNRMRFMEDFKNKEFVGKLIAFMDINKFKVLNDTLGHHFGDWGLIQMSNTFQKSNYFIVYRNSGDEFIVVSKESMNSNDFKDVMSNMNLSFYNEELKREIELTLSIGVIEEVKEDLTVEDMLVYLDYAMYDAKKHKKTMTIVDDALMEVYRRQKKLEQLLIEDIKSNKLLTYYQPMINIKEKKITSLEVLSRWKYNDQILSAASFIEVAKKIRYIEIMDKNLFVNLQLEYRKLQESCNAINEISFGVNLSAETLKLFEKDISEFDQFIEGNIIPKENLIFEISEDINLGIISDETIDNIRKKGYNLVIDDFGSGVSKLSDVLSGKLYAIKTDKSMLPKTIDNSQKVKGFNTIIKAINAAGSTVVVEGVETREQLEIVRNAGCNIVQGYLFGKPMSRDEVVTYINDFDFKDYE